MDDVGCHPWIAFAILKPFSSKPYWLSEVGMEQEIVLVSR